MDNSRAFYKLSLATLLAVYFLILVGGIVRSTGSGMGCPDWPKCFGRWVPPSSVNELPADYKDFYSEYRHKKNVRFSKYLRALGMGDTADQLLADKSVREEADFNAAKTWVEYINRVIGVIIGFLIFAVAVASIRFWRKDRNITIMACLAFVLVGFQGWIGSIVVSTNLTPWTITVHMFLALVIVAQLVWLVDRSSSHAARLQSPTSVWLTIACIVVLLLQVLLGTQVREAIDAVAGIAVRSEWISQVFADLFIHRSFSWVVLLLHAMLIWNLMKTTANKAFPIALILLILSTVFTGVGMAYFGVPAFLQPLHLLLATVSFGVQLLLLLRLTKKEKTQLVGS